MELKWIDGKTLPAVELQKIARIDFSIPAEFDDAWAPTEAEISGRAEMFAKLGAADFFQVIYDGLEVAGFHLITEGKKSVAHISTLWLRSDLRRTGLAKQMKDSGVAWAKAAGFKFLQTGVHANNKRMHDINLKSGFEPFSIMYRLKL